MALYQALSGLGEPEYGSRGLNSLFTLATVAGTPYSDLHCSGCRSGKHAAYLGAPYEVIDPLRVMSYHLIWLQQAQLSLASMLPAVMSSAPLHFQGKLHPFQLLAARRAWRHGAWTVVDGLPASHGCCRAMKALLRAFKKTSNQPSTCICKVNQA